MTVTPSLNQDGTYVLTRNGFVVVVDDPLEDVEDVSLLTAEQLLAMQESLQGSPEKRNPRRKAARKVKLKKNKPKKKSPKRKNPKKKQKKRVRPKRRAAKKNPKRKAARKNQVKSPAKKTVPKIQNPSPIPRIVPIMKAAMRPEQKTTLQILVPILPKAKAMLVQTTLSKPRLRPTANRRLMKVHSTQAVFPITLPTLSPIN